MRRLHYVSLFIVALFATSCSYNELPEELRVEPIFEDKITLNVETRAETYEGKALDQEYFVTAQDLENFVKFRRDASKRPDLSVKEVVSYGFDDSQTLFYILNYDEGWEVISADKRTQPTLAHGDEGSFTMDTDNEAMKFWMNMLADVVLQKRQNTNLNEFKLSLETEKEYVDFWNVAIGNSNIIDTKAGGTYSYLVETEQNIRIETYGTELSTRWGQDSPWNTYCPYISNDTSEGRALAGCVAVAGAQALYYLRNHFQMQDIEIPSIATCTGTLDFYTRNFSAFNNITWNLLALQTNTSDITGEANSAIFIAYIGELVGMRYKEDYSSAQLADLPETVFEPYGISSVWTEQYDLNIIKRNLQRHLPVVIRGKEALLHIKGHAWVIDQYKTERLETIKYYAIFDSPQTEEYINTLDKSDARKRTITYTTISEKLWMNWGWDGDDNGWFATIPDEWWLVDNNGDEYRLKYNIKMIHDFTLN